MKILKVETVGKGHQWTWNLGSAQRFNWRRSQFAVVHEHGYHAKTNT